MSTGKCFYNNTSYLTKKGEFLEAVIVAIDHLVHHLRLGDYQVSGSRVETEGRLETYNDKAFQYRLVMPVRFMEDGTLGLLARNGGVTTAFSPVYASLNPETNGLDFIEADELVLGQGSRPALEFYRRLVRSEYSVDAIFRHHYDDEIAHIDIHLMEFTRKGYPDISFNIGGVAIFR
jgi:hypothetical protein